MFREFEEVKLTYLRDIRMEQWFQIQEQRLLFVIRRAFAEVEDPCRDYWVGRLHGYFCKRLRHVTKSDWIPFLASLSDGQAYGKLQQKKARTYCCLIRDTAHDICVRNHLFHKEGFDELWENRNLKALLKDADPAEVITYM